MCVSFCLVGVSKFTVRSALEVFGREEVSRIAEFWRTLCVASLLPTLLASPRGSVAPSVGAQHAESGARAPNRQNTSRSELHRAQHIGRREVFAFFIETCMKNMHIILTLSPIGEAFRCIPPLVPRFRWGRVALLTLRRAPILEGDTRHLLEAGCRGRSFLE